MDTFSQFELSASTMAAIAAKGYEVPSPIQKLSIPVLLAGHDLIAQAQTGTGKTAAFGIPLVERFRDDEQGGVAALTLVPTRELAIQVAEELQALAKGTRLDVVAVYGGAGFGKQKAALETRRTVLLVATPGRLLDHLQQNTVDLSNIGTLILDEADRMLDMGFVRDVEKIMRSVPQDRHTMLFSATVPDEIRRLSKKYLHEPEFVKIEAETATADRVDQYQVKVEKADKKDALLDILHHAVPERAIVFTRTKHLAKRLALQLQSAGWGAVALQGNMTQGQRERALGAFRDDNARILVATDVAARGLDIPAVSHIVNFDLPDGADTYVHRIGRTARMGREGVSITFVQGDERRDMQTIERQTGATIRAMELVRRNGDKGPDEDQVAKLKPQGQGQGQRGDNHSGTGRTRGGGTRGGNARGRQRRSGRPGGQRNRARAR